MKLKKVCMYVLIVLMSAFFLVGCDSVKGDKDKSDDNGGAATQITVKSAIDDVLSASSYTFKIDGVTYLKYEDGNLYFKRDSLTGNRNRIYEFYAFIYDEKYYFATVENGNTTITETIESRYFFEINRRKFSLFEDSSYAVELYMRCLSYNVKAFAIADADGTYFLKSTARALADDDLTSVVLSADKNGLKVKAAFGEKTFNAEFTDINKTTIRIPQNVLSEIN